LLQRRIGKGREHQRFIVDLRETTGTETPYDFKSFLFQNGPGLIQQGRLLGEESNWLSGVAADNVGDGYRNAVQE
jgi:hypothetical protein